MEDFFSKRFRRSSEIELIRILENRYKYEPEAVEAAFKELQNRELIAADTSPDISSGELNKIRTELLHKTSFFHFINLEDGYL